MNTTSKLWIPAGDLTPAQAHALAVPTTTKPDRTIYIDQLGRKFQTLIDQLPKREAADLMTGSFEHLPEIYLIGLNQLPRGWGVALANSDTVSSLSNRIDWSQAGRLQNLPPQSLREILEQMP